MKCLEVILNWKWFNNYFDFLKAEYKTGYFLIQRQQIVRWMQTAEDCYEEAMKLGLKPGKFSIQGFKDVEEPQAFYNI